MKTRVFQFSNGKFLTFRGKVFENSRHKFGFNVTDNPIAAKQFEAGEEPDTISFLDGEFVTLEIKVTHD